MKINRGGSHSAELRDKKLNIAGKPAAAEDARKQAKLSSTMSQTRFIGTQSQIKLSSTQTQAALSSTQSQRRPSKAEFDAYAAHKAANAAKRRVLYILVAAIAAILIISVAIVLQGLGDDRSYTAYYNQAQESYRRADYESALSSLRKAVALEASDDALMLMVDCYLACGNMDRALEILRTMDVHDPEIAKKIDSVERARSAAQAAQRVSVGSDSYPVDTKSLVLDGMGMNNQNLEEIAQLYALNNLSLANNSISNISPVAKLGGLTTLNLSNNNISDLQPLSALGGLRTLYLDANPIEDFSPLYSLSSLTTLSIRSISISDTQLSELSAALPGCAIHCEAATEDVLEINFGGVSFTSDVTEINLCNLGITDISVLSSCKNLKSLDLSGNYIADITPLMDIPGLEWLSIENNRVSDLRPLMGISSLRVVNAANNNISSIAALGSLTELAELYLGNNPIEDFSAIKKLSKLRTLGLEGTGLDDSGLECVDTITDLRIFMAGNNPAMTGNAMDKFKADNINCKVYHDDLVYIIDLGGRLFRDDITELDAAYLGITDISAMAGFDHLEKVNLCGNSITNIYIFQWLGTVKELNLSGNGLVDITAIANLKQLEVIDLSNNAINSATPLYLLPKLREIHIGGNPLTEQQLNELRAYLPNCTIYSD